MNLTVELSKPEIKSSFDWQLIQEVNVLNDEQQIIAKAELELITLNKHRDAAKSYEQLASDNEATDWELPLNLYFKNQNLSQTLCEQLDVKADIKKAKTHMLIEAISVLPEYRKQGVAKFLLQEIAKAHPKTQSISVLSMPMALFVDADDCEDEASKSYYQAVQIKEQSVERTELKNFFTQTGFIEFAVDESLLNEPLVFDVFVSTPDKITAA